MRILFLPGSYSSPPARFRMWQFVEPLQTLGHSVEVRVPWPERSWSSQRQQGLLRNIHNRLGSLARVGSAFWMLRDASYFDLIMMNRDVVPDPSIDFIEPWLAKRNARLVFDFDDAIHLGRREQKLRKILPHFAWITPGNAYLAEFAHQVSNRVTVLPTVVNTADYRPAGQRAAGPLRIGWSGSRSTLQYCLPLLEKVITSLAETEEFEFLVIADVPPKVNWPNVKMRYIQWTHETEVEGLQQIDIGLMPLNDEPFERGKCGLKALQYMGVGIPTVVSPVGVNRNIVIDGVTGFHAVTDDDYYRRIKLLLRDEALRLKLGTAGRIRVEETYSVRSLLPSMMEVFEQVLECNPSEQRSIY